MLKGLCIGDLHLSRNFTFLPNLLDIQIKQLRKMLFVARDKQVKVFLMGDIFDHPYPSPLEQKKLLEVLCEFSDLSIYIISGNHDYSSIEENSLELYSYLQNTKSLNHVKVYTEKMTSVIDGVNIHFMPWPYEKPKLKKPSLVLAHNELKGATSDTGYELKDGAPIEDIGRNFYILGHLHRYQKSSRYVYVGTPLQMSFGEPLDKSFTYFEAEYVDKKLNVKHRRIPIELPYRLITINAKKSEDFEAIKKEENTFYSLIIKKGLVFDKSILNHPNVVKFRGSNQSKEQDIDTTQKVVSFDPKLEISNYLEKEYKYKPKRLKRAMRIIKDL